MTLICSVIGHTASPTHHHNQGLDFTICHACGCDLIRAEGDWIQVPRGYRVVWRELARPIDAGSVADRMQRHPVTPAPRRRLPRGGRPAPRRDPRGRPVRSAFSMLELLASLGQLVRAADDRPDTEVPPQGSTRPICLPRL